MIILGRPKAIQSDYLRLHPADGFPPLPPCKRCLSLCVTTIEHHGPILGRRRRPGRVVELPEQLQQFGVGPHRGIEVNLDGLRVAPQIMVGGMDLAGITRISHPGPHYTMDAPNRASGPQNQPKAKVAVSTESGWARSSGGTGPAAASSSAPALPALEADHVLFRSGQALMSAPPQN